MSNKRIFRVNPNFFLKKSKFSDRSSSNVVFSHFFSAFFSFLTGRDTQKSELATVFATLSVFLQNGGMFYDQQATVFATFSDFLHTFLKFKKRVGHCFRYLLRCLRTSSLYGSSSPFKKSILVQLILQAKKIPAQNPNPKKIENRA